MTFLTRLPGRHDGPLGAATRLWGIAAVLVALVEIVALLAGSWLVHPAMGAIAAIAAGVWFTRGLHLDGLADCLDGLLCNGDRERRLAVMHDPHVGALAAGGLALWLLARVAAVYACVATGRAVEALILAALVARGPLAAELRWGRPATRTGLFAAFHAAVTSRDAAISGGIALVAAVGLLAVAPTLVPAAGVGMAMAFGVTGAWHRTWRTRLGGLTGDVLGAEVELREMCVLCALGSPLL